MGATLYFLPAGVLLSPQGSVQFSSNNFTDFLTTVHKSKIMHIHELIIGREQGLKYERIYVVKYIL